jgi:hypothetical protein
MTEGVLRLDGTTLKTITMKNRLFSNYVTTILGLLIIIFCGTMIFMEKATIEDMSGWMTTGLLFLRSKDSLIALPKS